MNKSKGLVLKYIKNYRFHSIFLKNLMILLVCLLIPFACAWGISVYAYDNIRNYEEKAYTDEIATQMAFNVNSIFREVESKIVILEADQNVDMFFYSRSIEDDYFYSLQEIRKLLGILKLSSYYMEDIYLYDPVKETVVSSKGKYLLEDFADGDFLRNISNNEKTFWIEERNGILSLYYCQSQKALGHGRYFVMNVNSRIFKEKVAYGDNVFFEIVQDGKIILSNMSQSADEKIVRAEKELSKENLKLVVYLQSQAVEERLIHTRNIFFGYVFILFLIVLVVTWYLSVKMFNPLKHILTVLERARFQNEDGILESKNELSYVSNAIESTLSKKSDIEKELAERLENLKKAQKVALQSQINPHFINNTLDTVNWIATGKLGEDNEISSMVIDLSKILRMSMENTDTVVTLAQEVEYSKIYVNIQKKRYDHKFEAIWNIPEELMNCKLIRVILQPLLENAIYHGIEPFEGNGIIDISAKQIGDMVYITVSDSGFGMTEEEVENITRILEENEIKENRHIGLSNVHQRLRLTFGEQAGVVIKSELNFGTSVTIAVPYCE